MAPCIPAQYWLSWLPVHRDPLSVAYLKSLVHAVILTLLNLLRISCRPRCGRRIAVSLQFVVASLLLVTSAQADAVLVVRFSHVVSEDTPKGMAANRFKELVEKRSDNRIRVDVYPRSTLYDDKDEMLALQLGAVEIIAPSLSKFGRFGFPNFELFDLPFLFRTIEDVHRITEGPVGKGLLKELSRQQFLGLGFLDNGFKHMSANRPLLHPKDYKGLRMRIQPSRLIAAQMQALGARPIPLALSETRTALARNVVDGTENPLSNFVTQQINEVQSDLTLTNHGYLGYAVVTNQRFWHSLTEQDRSVLAGAMADALVYGNQLTASHDDKALAVLHETDQTRIHVLSDAERAGLKAAMKPVYESAKTRISAKVLDQVFQDLSEQRQ
ncbi:DctP family TRAP transporter solute-binding subunit [Pigmentiphaga litoralis]|uniref:C4-dicarboxylate-binding protein DctP n=1 Tax=Pigmentiphaga litoralis TaxID=516702 RepID=A0A7Y9IQR3_9BURK|nr:DctP family TRAP transporter solute-binding subunit [Pigmentiphaga litoralis]NYE25137.1 C4-dicarboxylate-binding protein DctP [Pigmentiphaga litoralis]NYE81249.1 C4-dicarboxylate-binding protein DctP [Pigmentiphaga litoralis]